MRPHALFLGTTILATQCATAQQGGELDLPFGEEGAAFASYDGSDDVTCMTLLPDDAIIVGGYSFFAGAGVFAKFTANGEPDTGFGTDGVALLPFAPEKAYVCGIAPLPNGQLLVGGFIWGTNGAVRTSYVARLHANGSPDAAFGVNGVAEFELSGWSTRAEAMVLLPDGKVAFTGQVKMGGTEFAFVARLNDDGTLDASFATGGIRSIYLGGVNQSGRAIAPLPDGRLLVACNVGEPGGFNGLAVVRFNADGIEDQSFGDDGYVYDPVIDPTRADVPAVLLPDANNAFMLACRARTSIGSLMGLIAYNANGTRIGTFGDGGMVLVEYGGEAGEGDRPHALVRDAEGRFVMVGTLWTFDEDRAIGLARIMPDGTLDGSFGNNGVVFDDGEPDGAWYSRLTAEAAGIQSDGRIVVAGEGYNWNSLNGSDYAVARYFSGTVGMNELSAAIGQVQVSPNPVADHFTLSFDHGSTGPLRIELLDLQGRSVHRFAQRTFPQGEQRMTLPWPAHAAAGAYTIVVVSEHGAAHVKVLR